MRGALTNSSLTPASVGGVRSWHIASHAMTADDSTPAAADHDGPKVGVVGHAPQWAQVLLAVQDEATLVDVAIEVDRELRDAQHRAVDAKQHFVDASVRPHRQPSRQAEVTVEPRIEQHARRTPRRRVGENRPIGDRGGA